MILSGRWGLVFIQYRYIDLVIREEPLGSRGTFQVDSEMSADVLKPQAAFRSLGDTVLGGSTMFCGLGESIEPPASTTFGR